MRHTLIASSDGLWFDEPDMLTVTAEEEVVRRGQGCAEVKAD